MCSEKKVCANLLDSGSSYSYSKKQIQHLPGILLGGVGGDVQGTGSNVCGVCMEMVGNGMSGDNFKGLHVA